MLEYIVQLLKFGLSVIAISKEKKKHKRTCFENSQASNYISAVYLQSRREKNGSKEAAELVFITYKRLKYNIKQSQKYTFARLRLRYKHRNMEYHCSLHSEMLNKKPP